MDNTSTTSLTDVGFSFDDEFSKLVEEFVRLNEEVAYAAPIAIGLLLAIGLLGNLLVVYISVTTQQVVEKPIHNLLVLNLAVADLTYLLASAPYQISAHIVPMWIYGSFMCPTLHFLNVQTMSVSIFTMCSLAFMRFLAVTMPLELRTSVINASKKKSACFVILGAWILGTVLAAPNASHMRLQKTENNSGEVCKWIGFGWHEYNISLLVATYALPFLLLVVSYFFIVKVILGVKKKDAARRASSNSNTEHPSESREYLRTTHMIFCLICAFLVCWFPHHLYTMIEISERYSGFSYAKMRVIMDMVGRCFSYAHACVNPIIYTFAAPGFRKSIGEMCDRRRFKNNSRTTQFTPRTCTSFAATSRRSSHKSSRMLASTNHDAGNNLKLTPVVNSKTSFQNTSLLMPN